MSPENKHPDTPESREPQSLGELLPGILGEMAEGEPYTDPGRKLSARLREAERQIVHLQEEIDNAKAEGATDEDTAPLRAELEQAKTQAGTIRQGYLPGQDTRPE